MALFEHTAEIRIVLDHHEAARVEAALEQRPRDGPGSRPEFDDEAIGRRPEAAAMARASARPDGATAPVKCGVDRRDMKKRALSPKPRRPTPSF